jgi:Spy/CpxP family protein refolding chaperone
MKKSIFAILVFAFISISIQSLLAQQRGNRTMKGKMAFQELNLTETQKEKFNEIRFTQQESEIEIEAALKKNRLELKKMLASNNFNESDLMRLIDKGNDLRASKQKSKVKMFLTMRNILDDDQKKIFAERFQKMALMGNRFGDRDKRDGRHFSRRFDRSERGKIKYDNNWFQNN